MGESSKLSGGMHGNSPIQQEHLRIKTNSAGGFHSLAPAFFVVAPGKQKKSPANTNRIPVMQRLFGTKPKLASDKISNA